MKKLFLSVLTLLMALVLVACDITGSNGNDNTNDADLSSILSAIEVGYGELDNQNNVTMDLILPTSNAVNGSAVITWESNREDVVSITSGLGVVSRLEQDVFVSLTVYVTLGEETLNREFIIKVIGTANNNGGGGDEEDEEVDFEAIFASITLVSETTTNLTLPSKALEANITWVSSNQNVISNAGVVTRGTSDQVVTLTATAKLNNQEDSFDFVVKVLKKVDVPVSEYDSVASVRDKAVGTEVTVEGVITSLMTNGNFTIQDASGAIPIFMNDNNALTIGKHYVVTGAVSDFNGLLQIGTRENKPVIVSDKGVATLPDVVNLTGYSLDFDDVLLYEGYVVSYNNLEVTSITTPSPNNAYELHLKNSAGETTMVRLDTRVNTTNALSSIKVGEFINLTNVSVGQYSGKAQLLYTSRSSVVVVPKDVNQPMILGTTNHTYVIDESDLINFLAGVSAADSKGTDYSAKLSVDASKVKYDIVGDYEVTYTLSGIAGYDDIVIKVMVSVREIPEPGSYTGYYSGLAGLTGSSLNSALESLIKNTGSSTGTTSQVQQVDRTGSSYYLIYTGNGSYGNREHVVPNSKLPGAKDDLHNLRASIVSVNSSRSNYPFTEKPVGNNGSYQLVNKNSWYPGDEHVGDVARIVLYMYLRQPGINRSSVGSVEMLVRWHLADPVNDFELTRNDRIQSIQRNRNPFIDHPELVEIYFGTAKPRSSRIALDNAIRLNEVVINNFTIFNEEKKTRLTY